MSIDIIPINGKSSYIDYDAFEKSVRETIGKKCSDAKVFLFNNFPVSVSIETNIDLIIIIAIENKKGNFYIPKSNGEKPVYFYNQIIPLKFITHFKDDTISIEDGDEIITNDEFIDYSTEINSMRFSLMNYLANKCGFKRNELYVRPLIFIQNQNEFVIDNYLIGKTLDFKSIHKYFSYNHADIFISYKDWKTEFGYSTITNDVERITEQASKDSEIGYLTKKKVERIGKQLSSSKIIYEELNKNLVIISGKAGTGKSSELLLLSMNCISKGQNTLFLTYNKLLIFDIAKTVKSYVNARLNNSNQNNERPGEGSVLTLHSFFYRLSKSLGVLHVLNAERIEKLLLTLKYRMRSVFDLISSHFIGSSVDYEFIKTEIQNYNSFDIGTKEVGIDLLNFLQKKNVTNSDELKNISIEFFNHKKRIVGNIEANEVFLADYYGVLENTLLAIQDPQKYFEKYNLQDKFDLLEIVLNLKDKHIEKGEDGIKIKPKGFKEQKNRSVGGYRRKRTLFVDEAQDCHTLEKDILISIFGNNNIVVANGGKEQLIRHVELCNWEMTQGSKLEVKKHYTRNKSFRVKKTIVDFCNFVGNKFQIDLNLEPLDSEDEGELLFDFRQNHSEIEITEIFNQLKLKGEVSGCSPYESILILLESNSQRLGLSSQPEPSIETAIINEYGNIEDAPNLVRGTWKHIATLEKKDFKFWDGTVDDKSQLIVPSPNESRIIYYESCRGLEAWSVACFSLDKFFNQKMEDPDAERFLIDDKEKTKLTQDMFKVSNEDRKKMYAATWILMAMTRVIDTLYIQINDTNSEFGKVVVEYLKQGNKNVRQLTKNVSS